jgi:hypothetical protein
MINNKLLKIKIYVKLFEITNILMDLLGEKTNIGNDGNPNNIPPNFKWLYTMYRLSPNLIRNLGYLLPDDLVDSNIILLLVFSTNIVFYLYLLKIKYYKEKKKDDFNDEDDFNDDDDIID